MSKAKGFFLLILYSGLLFLNACKKEILEPQPISFNYFPTEMGKWVIFSVDSVYHSETDMDNDDSVYEYHFQIKEEIDSTITDLEGKAVQIVKRFRRDDDLSEWTLSDVWTQRINSTSAYRTENNIPFHKLSFPFNINTSWNGNDANQNEEEDYEYEFLHQAFSDNYLSFDSAVSVIQIDEDNYVEKIFGREVYAEGPGLVFKERDELGKKNGVIVKGFEMRMSAIDYGQN